MGMGLERSKGSGRDEPIGVVIHICMETTQGNHVQLSLSQTSKNTMFLCLSFMFFLLQNQRRGGLNRFCLGRVAVGRFWHWWAHWRMNMVQVKKKMYVNAKMILVESAPGMGKGR
jgi:hypothetical protein